jgi:DNA-binding transcriptional MerR regulator
MDYKEFSIKDLECFTGIKAHTIRIWEQRYGILEPQRTDTNIRKYSDGDLRRLLNVSMLNEMGYKISKIAGMSEGEITQVILDYLQRENSDKHFQQMLKIAMVNYDEELFNQVTEQYVKDHGMKLTFTHLFVPFLYQIGLLWQAGAICPSNEHFISNLIRQKLICKIEHLPLAGPSAEKTFVLYLPQQEIHDISLLMLHYLLREAGNRTIYLGISVPFEDLEQVTARLGDVHFVSIFTTFPSTNSIGPYLDQVQSKFGNSSSKFHLTGYGVQGIDSPNPELIKLYRDARELADNLV